MSNTPLSDSENSSSSERTPEDKKLELARQIFVELRGSNLLLEKVKWSIDFHRRKGEKVPWSPEAAADLITGNLVGLVAEVAAEKQLLSDCEVVYNPKNIPLQSLEVVSPQKFTGAPTNRKGDVISYLLKKSYSDQPVAALDPHLHMGSNPLVQIFNSERKQSGAPYLPPDEYKLELQKHLVGMRDKMFGVKDDPKKPGEIEQGFAWAEKREKEDGSVTPAGEFFAGTVIPDGIVLKNGELFGGFEMKAMTTEEFSMMISLIRKSGKETSVVQATAADFGRTYRGAENETFKAGVDIPGEVAFLDVIRSLTGGDIDSVLRQRIFMMVPNDTPNNLVSQYCEMTSSHPYTNEVVQSRTFDVDVVAVKSILTRTDMLVIAKEAVKAQWYKITLGIVPGSQYSDRDLKALHKFAFGD